MSDVIRFPQRQNAVTLLISELRDFAEACRKAEAMANQARRVARKPQGVVATILPVRRDLAPSSPDTSGTGKSLPGGGRQVEGET